MEVLTLATFGERFKMLRSEKNFNQEELIDDFNKKYHYSFTKSAVSQYENDKRIPEISALSDFADYFNVTVDYLLGKSDIRNPYVKYINEEQADHAVESDLNEYRQAKKFIDDLKEEMQKQGYDLNDKSVKEMSEILSLALKLADKTKSN